MLACLFVVCISIYGGSVYVARVSESTSRRVDECLSLRSNGGREECWGGCRRRRWHRQRGLVSSVRVLVRQICGWLVCLGGKWTPLL